MAYIVKVDNMRFGSYNNLSFFMGSKRVFNMYYGSQLVYDVSAEYLLFATDEPYDEQFMKNWKEGMYSYMQNGSSKYQINSSTKEMEITVSTNASGNAEVYTYPMNTATKINLLNYDRMRVDLKYVLNSGSVASGTSYFLRFSFFSDPYDSTQVLSRPSAQYTVSSFLNNWTTIYLDAAGIMGGEYYFGVMSKVMSSNNAISTKTYIKRMSVF